MDNVTNASIVFDERALKTFNGLIQHNLNAQAGYETAAASIKNEQYRAMLEDYAAQRAQFADELSMLIRRQGEDPVQTVALSDLFQQGWLNLKVALTNGDGAILAECQNADEIALSAYQDAIGDTTEEALLVVLRSEFTDVRNACERVKALAAALNSRGR